MATAIKDMLDSIPGVKKDWKEDWKEDAREDWKFDWDAAPGGTKMEAPMNTVAPVISGLPAADEMLTATPGTWTGYPAPTFTYEWFRDGTTSVGTGTTYTVVMADVGTTISVVVTATSLAGTATATTGVLIV